MDIMYVALLCACTLVFTYILHINNPIRLKPRFDNILTGNTADEDEDIKIATGSRATVNEDPGEAAARSFLEQKTSGNIEKASLLGIELADAIIRVSESGVTRDVELHQRLILNAYIVNQVIAEYSPNSILGQTSLRMFYKHIEENSDDLYNHISDMAAFSLYILCGRSSNKNRNEIGKVYAHLCGFDEDEECVKEGNRIYAEFYDFCIDKTLHTSYREV